MAATENITVLFTDLVGSTELASSLTPEAGDEVRRQHFSTLRQAIAETGGTEIKNLGDGIMVVFPVASAALSCAVVMQQAVDRDNRDVIRPLGLRVGLSCGEATREGDDYFGDPVVEAARLCAKAEGGQILATDGVRFLAGRRNRHACRPLGELTLKGLPDPIETVEVFWEPTGRVESSPSVPLPGRLAIRPGIGVVGRETELATVNDAGKRVATGEGRRVLLVSGEAGLGKTTLVAEATRALCQNGFIALFGHCEEDLVTPYQLFAEALGHYVTHAPEQQLLGHIEDHGSELSRLVPSVSSRVPGLPPSKATDADTERYLLFAAVVGLLGKMSNDQPVVLVLDDLQWADKGSLLLLRHLAAADESMRVLVIGTYRDNELSQSHALRETLGVLRRGSDVSRIELTGLDDSGVVSFLEAAAGQALEDPGVNLAHAVYRETDGNPFFVSEVLRHLSETGVIYQDSTTGRWSVAASLEQMALPDSVREVIGGRVVRLGTEAERVLSIAAVIGRDFDLDLLTKATNSTDDDLLDILDAAIAAALVRELADAPGHYSFSHALIQHTLYEDLGLTRRARAHRQVGEALEALCGDHPGNRVGELARHWFSATQPIDLTKAITYSRQAGDAALRALAPADALRYYAQALDLYPQATDPDPILGIDLAIGLGTAQRQTGDPAFRDNLLGAARRAAELGDTERLVAAALANDRGILTTAGAVDNEKVEVLELALERLPPHHPDRALVLATLCSELAQGSSLDRRRMLAAEALHIAESSGEDATIVRVLNHIFLPLHVPSLLGESLTRTADALVRAERLGDPLVLLWAADFRSLAASAAGDVDEVDRCIAIMGSTAEQLDQPTLNWVNTFIPAARAMIAGDVAQAESLATKALEIGIEGGQPDAATFFGIQLMSISVQRGSMNELVPLIQQALADNPGLPTLKATLAVAYAEGDQFEEARQLLEELAQAEFAFPLDFAWLAGMTRSAHVAVACRNERYAVELLDQLTPWSDQWTTSAGISSQGPVSLYLGGLASVLHRYDEADTYFSRSAAMSNRMGSKFFASLTDLWWGKMLIEHQTPDSTGRARDLLARARSVAEEHGYAGVTRRAIEALQSL